MVHTVTRFCTSRANCRIEQCIEERPAGSTRLSIKHSSERACRSFEPSESRREFDGVSNPRQLAPSPSAVGCAATHAKTRAWRLFPADSAPHSVVARMDSRLGCTIGTDGESFRTAKQLAIRYGSTRIQAARLTAESLNGSGAGC